MTDTTSLDALIVGAGFGGIYQLHSLLKLGISAQAIDIAGDVGGTWYWNRYPGAMSDTESVVYRYSWDKEDLLTYPWARHYVRQPEVLAYLEHVVRRHDLRKHMRFNTELVSATWDEGKALWRVVLKAPSGPQSLDVRYLVTGLGLLSKQNYPDYPNVHNFKGVVCHTASWRPEIELANKRVGIIGNGSTGVQVITDIAGKVAKLTSFQRHPQYTVPSGDGPVSPEYRSQINARYDEIMDQVKNSGFGFGYEEASRSYESVPEDEREQIFESLWSLGNGFRFIGSSFTDLTTNRVTNEAACRFIRKKIGQIVTDPVKAKKLMPDDLYTRRPLCDNGYYQQFNRDNVDIVDLKQTPITKFTERGILTSDGTEHEFDVIILATGFDSVDGNYNRIRIRGTGGRTLKDHWQNGLTSYLGMSVPHFPNLFMITGPMSAFSSVPPIIEAHVEFISVVVEHAEKNRRIGGSAVIEATAEAEEGWKQLCEELAKGSLFWETSSWIFGSNIPGKPFTLRFYFGGLSNFRKKLEQVENDGFSGFKPLDRGKGDGEQVRSRM